MLARCSTASLQGLEAQEVTVEVDLAPGLPGLHMVGLADAAVQESRERVRSALRHSGLKVPLTRVIVNLAPADLRKEGPGFDLPIALALLVASGQLNPEATGGVWSCGELGLDGSLRPVRGVLALALQALHQGARALVVPTANTKEAQLVDGLEVWPAPNLSGAVAMLKAGRSLVNSELPANPLPGSPQPSNPRPTPAKANPAPASPADLSDVHGQAHGRRALEIAAAGGHHLLLCVAPGSGKTMLAQRLAGLLSPLNSKEALEITRVHSILGLLVEGGGLVQQRPFRSPHHSCSAAALIGGGAIPRPGELSLAHHGVLFLDELAEFRRSVLDQLRQPLEEGAVWIHRSKRRTLFPCQITLVAACNPCPCGWHGDPNRPCQCGEGARRRYWAKLSGPLLDRLDLQVVMRRPSSNDLGASFRPMDPASKPETTAVVAKRVAQARQRMERRNPKGCSNGQLGSACLRKRLHLTPDALDLWEQALQQRQLSARAGDRLLRVAQTISDLDGTDRIGPSAIAEALTFRSFDQLL
ncbi:MAG: YifB family Mg chelatase-like AAA ATPase [Cyanobium sp. LacPavin_0920_WC12_MAG_62_9]|nr:YifB family Mg chelatase-like AAA ATPase [Cyanobium sp. LacPavin_0920_WC12_MAG_62_9]